MPQDTFPRAIGLNKSMASNMTVSKQVCILCQEEQDITHTGRAIVLAAFIQKLVDGFFYYFMLVKHFAEMYWKSTIDILNGYNLTLTSFFYNDGG